MKILHLTLKKKWFDMIASGEKKEEYRDIKMYWWTRLCLMGQCYGSDDKLLPTWKWQFIMAKKYDIVRFKNGYSKDAPEMDVEFINTHVGFPARMEWCDETNASFFLCIELGKILSIKNYKP